MSWVHRSIAALLAAAPATSAVASDVRFDRFLSGFERCAPTGEFEAFARSLAERHRNPCCSPGPANVDASVTIVVPPEVAAGVGAATSKNEGEYTEVTVPLTGTYGGVPLASFLFVFGNENGIGAASLGFAAPRAEIERRFGADVAAAADAGQSESEMGAGYTAVIGDGEPGAIVCDWST